MAMILKNTSGVLKQWAGIEIAAGDQYYVQEVDRDRLAADSDFLYSLATGEAVVNDGVVDLPATEGGLFVKGLLRWVNDDMILIPGAGSSAPALTVISNSVSGWEFDIGDTMYLHTKLDGIIGTTVKIMWHVCVNNSVADRWMAYEFYYTVRADGETTIMTTESGSIAPQPILVSTTPYTMMEVELPLPTSLFDSGVYVYMGIKRVSAASFGKTDVANNPILLKACKIHRRRLDYTP